MADRISKERRSWNMSRIPGRDTQPELLLRSCLHRSGYRFRLHHAKLPGRPDIVLPRFRAAVFVHGCFWHRHPGCAQAAVPKTNTAFWQRKFQDTVERDLRHRQALHDLGWQVITVWECDIRRDVSQVACLVSRQLQEVGHGT